MKIYFLIFLLASLNSAAQENFELKFSSEILSESRPISIHLPENYYVSGKSYPVIYCLDGEYTKFALNGTIEYYSFWDKIPECIVVSINQNYKDSTEKKYKRWMDCAYSWDTGLPKSKGLIFKDFISKELVPFIDSSYRTTKFKTIVGHSFTANYINYFLLDDQPIFTGFIAISPYYATNGLESIKTILEKIKTPLFYFVACGQKDLSGHIKSVNEFHKRFSKIKNENFVYKKFDMENNQATHTTIFPVAIPTAIEHVFSSFAEIDEFEYYNLLKKKDKVAYLHQRYENIYQIYGIEIPIRESDINIVSNSISETKDWIQLKEIAELGKKIYPKSHIGYWTMGEYFEKTENYSSALEQYKIGLSLLGNEVLNISDFQKDIDRVKRKLE